jgi:hypothetical protein
MEKWLMLFIISISVETGIFIFLAFNHRKMKDAKPPEELEVEDSWQAGFTRPVEILFLIAVFIPMIILALVIGKHPETTIRDLLLTCFVSCYAFGLGLMSKNHYFFTNKGIYRTKIVKGEFQVKPVFLWHQLKEIKPSRHGFNFKLKNQSSKDEKSKKPDKGFIPLGPKADEIINKLKAKGIKVLV